MVKGEEGLIAVVESIRTTTPTAYSRIMRQKNSAKADRLAYSRLRVFLYVTDDGHYETVGSVSKHVVARTIGNDASFPD